MCTIAARRCRDHPRDDAGATARLSPRSFRLVCHAGLRAPRRRAVPIGGLAGLRHSEHRHPRSTRRDCDGPNPSWLRAFAARGGSAGLHLRFATGRAARTTKTQNAASAAAGADRAAVDAVGHESRAALKTLAGAFREHYRPPAPVLSPRAVGALSSNSALRRERLGEKIERRMRAVRLRSSCVNSQSATQIRCFGVTWRNLAPRRRHSTEARVSPAQAIAASRAEAHRPVGDPRRRHVFPRPAGDDGRR